MGINGYAVRRTGLAVTVVAALALAGCAQPSQDRFSSVEVGQVVEVREGRVLDARLVEIQGEQTGTGALIGGVVGGAAGSAGTGGSAAATILSGIGGLIVGSLIERGVSSGNGIEYLVELNDGTTVAVVQRVLPDEAIIPVGSRALIQIGSLNSRIVLHPDQQS